MCVNCVPLPRNTLVASTTQVYMLEPKPFETQVLQLVQWKHFELALKIAVSYFVFIFKVTSIIFCYFCE